MGIIWMGVFPAKDTSSTPTQPCISVVFNGGPSGGTVTYQLCGQTKNSITTLGPGQSSVQLCVNNNSWTFGDFFMTASIQGPCSSSGSGGPTLDNAFTIERTSDGYSTYAQLNSSFAVNDIVNVSNDTECYEIMATANVTDPSLFPTISGECGGGDGDPSETTPNAFTVENTLDGYTIDVQYNSIYASGDIVSVSIHTGCYEILRTTTVSDPTTLPTISGICSEGSGGGGGKPSEP